jgi:hypothetical protein
VIVYPKHHVVIQQVLSSHTNIDRVEIVELLPASVQHGSRDVSAGQRAVHEDVIEDLPIRQATKRRERGGKKKKKTPKQMNKTKQNKKTMHQTN